MYDVSMYLSIYLSVCLSVCLSIYLFNYLSVCQSINLLIILSVYLYHRKKQKDTEIYTILKNVLFENAGNISKKVLLNFLLLLILLSAAFLLQIFAKKLIDVI